MADLHLEFWETNCTQRLGVRLNNTSHDNNKSMQQTYINGADDNSM